MRTLIPLLLLACLAYAGWFYWQRYTDRPLREPLLLAAASEIKRVDIGERPGEPSFQLRRADDDRRWIVSQDHRQLLDQTQRATKLIEKLRGLKSDSITRDFGAEEHGFPLTIYSEQYGAEELVLALPPEGPGLVRLIRTGDVFALPRKTIADLLPALRFDHYRERRLLTVDPERVSRIVTTYRDSLLWTLEPSDSLLRIARSLIAPAAAPYADYFDEIGDQDRYYATLNLVADSTSHRVTVYRDSLWPHPYVLVGEDYPRRFLAADSLR